MLFKSLWQKLGQNDDAGDLLETSPAEMADRSIVGQLTHISEFHLERLEKLLLLRFQKDFRPLDDTRLKALIHYASRIQDSDIQRELLLFYLNCPPSIQAHLRSGDTMDESHVLHKAPKPWL